MDMCYAYGPREENTDLIVMSGALWYDLPSLPGHEIQQLVDEERRWQGLDATSRDRDQFAAYGTSVETGEIKRVINSSSLHSGEMQLPGGWAGGDNT